MIMIGVTLAEKFMILDGSDWMEGGGTSPTYCSPCLLAGSHDSPRAAAVLDVGPGCWNPRLDGAVCVGQEREQQLQPVAESVEILAQRWNFSYIVCSL